MKKEKTRKELNKNLLIVAIFLVIAAIILIILNIISNSKEEINWDDDNYGDIAISDEEEEEKEVFPDNITDAYGLEYEYTKIPAYGFSTYIPVGWEIKYEKDFLYFIAPEDSDYQYTEIAFCTMDLNSIYDKTELMYITDYAQKNIRNHNHDYPFVISTVSNNQYVELKDGDRLIGYYCQPLTEFIWEDEPIKSHWSPYTVFYQLNTNASTTTFSAVVGPRNNYLQIDEIGKTIAYNTFSYSNTDFDYNEFEKISYEKQTIGNMFFRVKSSDDVVKQGNTYNLSNNPKSLAFNCKLQVQQDYLEGELDDYLTDEKMLAMWVNSNDVIKENYTEFNNKNLDNPTFKIESSENVAMFNKNCRKITWRVDLDITASSRKYVNAIMPATFTTYLVPDGNNVYSYTINYTVYQKYSALKYIEKTMQLSGFNN